MASDRPSLTAQPRTLTGSRNGRRLRREGMVPGIVYGSGREPVSLQVPDRELRLVLASGQALFDLALEGDSPVPVVLKERQNHPVRDQIVHVDFQQVRLDVKIESAVAVVLEGTEDAPGVKESGVLEQPTTEVVVLALPAEIPEQIVVDVSKMEIGDTLMLDAIAIPADVEFVDDPATTVLATLSPPRVMEDLEPDLEEETELVGEEGEERPEGEGEGGDDQGDQSEGGAESAEEGGE